MQWEMLCAKLGWRPLHGTLEGVVMRKRMSPTRPKWYYLYIFIFITARY